MKMGCKSSTQYSIDPVTGKEIKKKTLGGAYPGQRRTSQQPYTPPPDQFGPDGKATAHFMAYGGGNALTLVQQDGSYQPQTGGAQPEYIQVTLPDGVYSGQTIHVQAPDGRLNEVVVPPGFGPGSTFTVEFAPEAPPPSPAQSYYQQQPPVYSSPQQQQYAPPPQTYSPGGDDGFVSGFNSPGYVPPSAQAHAVHDPYESAPYYASPYDSSYPVANSSSAPYGPPQYPKY